jgi:alkylhydroperoxidase/carboxymuconolactone decarboxylase family protein YurZ
MPYNDTLIVDWLTQAHQTPLLTDREKHLVGLAVTMTRGCQVCTRNRIEKVRAIGVSDEVVNALVGVVSAVNAGVTAATAREAFRMADSAPPESCGSLCSAEDVQGGASA